MSTDSQMMDITTDKLGVAKADPEIEDATKITSTNKWPDENKSKQEQDNTTSTTLTKSEKPSSKPGFPGRSCHQCKNAKALSILVFCTNLFDKRARPGKRRCRKKFCTPCLKKFYPEETQKIIVQTGICASCRGICSCAACFRKRNSLRADTRSIMSGVANVMQRLNFSPNHFSPSTGFQQNPLMSFPNANLSLNTTGMLDSSKNPSQDQLRRMRNVQQLQQQLHSLQAQLQLHMDQFLRNNTEQGQTAMQLAAATANPNAQQQQLLMNLYQQQVLQQQQQQQLQGNVIAPGQLGQASLQQQLGQQPNSIQQQLASAQLGVQQQQQQQQVNLMQQSLLNTAPHQLQQLQLQLQMMQQQQLQQLQQVQQFQQSAQQQQLQQLQHAQHLQQSAQHFQQGYAGLQQPQQQLMLQQSLQQQQQAFQQLQQQQALQQQQQQALQQQQQQQQSSTTPTIQVSKESLLTQQLQQLQSQQKLFQESLRSPENTSQAIQKGDLPSIKLEQPKASDTETQDVKDSAGADKTAQENATDRKKLLEQHAQLQEELRQIEASQNKLSENDADAFQWEQPEPKDTKSASYESMREMSPGMTLKSLPRSANSSPRDWKTRRLQDDEKQDAEEDILDGIMGTSKKSDQSRISEHIFQAQSRLISQT